MYTFKRVLTILAVLAVIISVLVLIAVDTELIYISNVNINVLLKNQKLDMALSGPTYEEGEHSELLLKEEYVPLSSVESKDLTDAEKLSVINRWTSEVYPNIHAYILASLLDPSLHTVADELLSNNSAENDIPTLITAWSDANLIHTQSLQIFRSQPGNDPWGLVNLVYPAYRKLLPSEMIAESIYSGKMSGKCESIAVLNAGLFTVLGCEPENVLLLRRKSHVLGLVRYEDGLYLIDNKKIEPVTDEIEYYLKQIDFTWYFTYTASEKLKFKLNDTFFDHSGSLQQAITEITRTSKRQIDTSEVFYEVDIQNRQALYQRVFSDAENMEIQKLFTLTRYAYQSIYVNDPELYLEASIRAPVTKALSKKLHTRDEIFRWIRNHVVCAPIFEDYRERIMIADQVIVFGKGTIKDQALLACALLCSIGEDPVLKLTNNSAYIEVNDQLYDARTWDTADLTTGNVILEIQQG